MLTQLASVNGAAFVWGLNRWQAANASETKRSEPGWIGFVCLAGCDRDKILIGDRLKKNGKVGRWWSIQKGHEHGLTRTSRTDKEEMRWELWEEWEL